MFTFITSSFGTILDLVLQYSILELITNDY